MSKKENLLSLIQSAREFGLPESDIEEAKELLEHFEFGISLDLILTQLYEYNVAVNREFVDAAFRLNDQMGVSNDDYYFMKELIND